jgi:uncharacterized protein DUF4148
MNRYILSSLLALAAAATTSAFADDITIDNQPFVSSLSRSEVMSELRQFKQAGHNPWDQNYDQLSNFTSSKTRAQVTAEFLESRDEVARMTAEDSGSASLHPTIHAIAAPVVARRAVDE